MIDAERRAERGEQLLLARGFRELARQRFARVAHRGVNEILLFAAPRRADRDAMAGARAQDLAQGLGARNRVAQQHEARRRPFEVELREKGVEHLLAGERPVGARKIGAVAPVLVGAEEERLDAEYARLLGDGEHVGFGDRARIDALLALDRRQRADAVAQPRRLFEVERRRGFAHLGGEALFDRAAAAGEEIARLH